MTDSLGENDPQYQQEASFTAAQWRRRLREHAQFAALIGDRPVGLIGAQLENAETVYLYSLWLDPAARGHGLARPLVAAAVDWARDRRARTVTLRVAADNAVARGVYESLGFTVTSGRSPWPADEVAMSLSVVDVGPVAAAGPRTLVHGVDGALLVDGLDRHHRDVLVVGQVHPAHRAPRGNDTSDDVRPRDQLVAEQVSHRYSRRADPQPRPGEQQHQRPR